MKLYSINNLILIKFEDVANQTIEGLTVVDHSNPHKDHRRFIYECQLLF